MVYFGQSFESVTGTRSCRLYMYVTAGAVIADIIQGSFELGEIYRPQDWREISPRDYPDCLFLIVGGHLACRLGVFAMGHSSAAFWAILATIGICVVGSYFDVIVGMFRELEG